MKIRETDTKVIIDGIEIEGFIYWRRKPVSNLYYESNLLWRLWIFVPNVIIGLRKNVETPIVIIVQRDQKNHY